MGVLGEKICCEISSWFTRWLNHIDICIKQTLQREDQIIAYGPWENLSKDIMEEIALQLSLNDYIRSSFVCKSWQSLLLKSDILRPQIPWLLFPHNPSSHNIKFYNFLEKKFHNFMLPEDVDGRKVVGCSKGWVVLMTKCTSEISLFNPIFGATYHLPSLPTTSYLQRIELSSSNISECTVAAIFDNFEKLALCKLEDGHKRWEVIPIGARVGLVCCTLIDVLFSKQKLHVLIKSENGNGKVENIVVKLPNFGEDIPITLVHDLNYKDNIDVVEVDGTISLVTEFRVFVRYLHLSYLVESTTSQVLLIQKHHCLFCIIQKEQVNKIHEYFDMINNKQNLDEEDNNVDFNGEEEGHNIDPNEEEEEEIDVSQLVNVVKKLDGFKIYEIEDLRRNKKKICKGLGKGKDGTLFLSSKSRVCLPSNASNRLKGNSIHFIMDNAKTLEDCGLFFIGDNGTHNLDDSTVHSSFPEFKKFWNSKFMWLAPNLVM